MNGSLLFMAGIVVGFAIGLLTIAALAIWGDDE